MLAPLGGFATGIIPPTGVVNGSSATVLKMYRRHQRRRQHGVRRVHLRHGAAHNLYRNVMAFDAGSKPARHELADPAEQHHRRTPAARRCFTYQTRRMTVQGTPFTFVLDVAVTLTVQTQQIDPVTQAVSDGNQGAPERVAAQRLQRLDAGGHRLHRPHSVDAGHDHGAAALTVMMNDCMTPTNERGIALVLALFLMSAMSVLAASLMFLSQTETYASMNYRMMSQARYAGGAAVQKAVQLPARHGAVRARAGRRSARRLRRRTTYTASPVTATTASP